MRTINNFIFFIFNLYIQLIIAGLKTSLHLTPFRFLNLILAITKKEKFYVLNIGGCQIANQNFSYHLIGSLTLKC